MSTDQAPFGKAALNEFLFDKGWKNLNHGSFGTYPKAILECLRQYQTDCEERPDSFIRYDTPKLLDRSREAVAKLVSAPTETITFVTNATTGVNTVIRNLEFEKGDYILYCDTIYGACEKTVQYICETTPASSVRFMYAHPVEDEELVANFEKEILNVVENGGRVKVAIFDTVSSVPGLRVPWEDLVKVCKKHQVLSLVDGAHAIGMIHLDLQKTDPDFFVSNCHKWLFVPRGCAALYVPIRNQHLVRSTLPTSHGFIPRDSKGAFNPLPLTPEKSAYLINFDYNGTRDDATFFCAADAIEYRERVFGGEEAIRKYCFDLAHKGADVVANILGTELLTNKSGSLQECTLFNVRLPLEFDSKGETKVPDGQTLHALQVIPWLQKKMVNEHNTFIATFWYQNALWVRLSAQVYLELEDFEWAAELLKTMCSQFKK